MLLPTLFATIIVEYSLFAFPLRSFPFCLNNVLQNCFFWETNWFCLKVLLIDRLPFKSFFLAISLTVLLFLIGWGVRTSVSAFYGWYWKTSQLLSTVVYILAARELFSAFHVDVYLVWNSWWFPNMKFGLWANLKFCQTFSLNTLFILYLGTPEEVN